MLLHLLLFACSSQSGAPSESDPAGRSATQIIQAGKTGAELEKASEKIAVEARKRLDALPDKESELNPSFLTREVAEVRKLVESLENQIEQAAKELRIEKE